MIRGAMVFLGLTFFVLVGCVSSQGLPAHRDYETISSYIEAYNERNVQAMSALMHSDVQWLSVAALGSKRTRFAIVRRLPMSDALMHGGTADYPNTEGQAR